MKVKVLIPFHLSAKNHDCVPGETIDVTDEQLAKIRAINVNMVEVVKEVEKKKPAEKPAGKPKSKN